MTGGRAPLDNPDATSDSHPESFLDGVVQDLFHGLGWKLVKFRWIDTARGEERDIVHYLACEGTGSDPARTPVKPWFIVCVPGYPLLPQTLSKYIRASWNMDFPVLVILNRDSLLVYDCIRRYFSGEPVPDISLDITDSGALGKRLYDVFSLQEPGQTGFWRFIRKLSVSREGQETGSVEDCLLQTLDSWWGFLARRIYPAAPGSGTDKIDSKIMGAVLRLFWEKTAREYYSSSPSQDMTVPEDTNHQAGHTFPLHLDGSSADVYPAERELIERGLLETDFFFSLIPFPRIISAFHRAINRNTRTGRKLHSRPYMGEISLPPDNVVDSCLDLAIQRYESQPGIRRTILDPACGCGLFVSRIPQFLLAQKRAAAVRESFFHTGLLPCRPDLAFIQSHNFSKEEILEVVGALFGADPDPHAADTCRCVLALVIREMAGKEVWKEISADIAEILENNIVSRDILIGKDFGSVVNWKFPGQPHLCGGYTHQSSMKWGDFDIITGFFDISGREIPTLHRHYLQTRYSVYHRDSVPASCLIERAFQLLSPEGVCLVVLPGRWLRSNAFKAMRSLLSRKKIHSIIEITFLFMPRRSDSHYSILTSSSSSPGGEVGIVQIQTAPFRDICPAVQSRKLLLPQEMLGPGGWSLVDRRLAKLERKISSGRPSLEEYVMGSIHQEHLPDGRHGGILSRNQAKTIQADRPEETVLLRPFVSGESISRYGIPKTDNFIRMDPAFLDNPISAAAGLLIAAGEKGISCTLNRGKFCAGREVLLIPGEDMYLLGILNSAISSFYIGRLLLRHPGSDIISLVRRIPIHVADPGNPDEILLYKRLVAATRRMLSLHEALAHDYTKESEIQPLIEETDSEIDALCFHLYGLSDDEIRIITSSLNEA